MTTDVRIKDLSSPVRAGSFARREARARQWEVVQRSRGPLAIMAVATGLALVVANVAPAPAYVHGLLTGGGVVAAVAMTMWTVVLVSGTAPQLSGSLAEEWTVEALAPLMREGFRLINGGRLKGHRDLDHLLIGPTGIYLLDTKWRAREWDQAQMARAATTLEGDAKTLSLFLKQEVTPVLVLWGKAAESLATGSGVQRNGGVWAMPGGGLVRWLRGRASGQLSPDEIHVAWRLVADSVERREAHEGPQPLSLRQVADESMWVLGAGLLGLIAPAFLLPPVPGPWPRAAVAVALVAVSLVIRRLRGCRLRATALAAGTFAWLCIALLDMLL